MKLTSTYAEELLRRQDALQAEATRVVSDLDLVAQLGRAGLAEQVGSSVSGLMVWRDIDFTVTSPGMTTERAWAVMQPIVSNPRVTRVAYSNEIGHLNQSGQRFDDRHYFILHYETNDGDEWKIDITFWVVDGPRHHRTRALAYLGLARQQRVRILWLKDIWHRLPTYPYQVGGTDIYDAVLEHGVCTPEELDAYLIERGMPSRVVDTPQRPNDPPAALNFP